MPTILSPKEFMKMEKPTVKKATKKVPIEDYIEMRCYIKYNLFYGQPKKMIKRALLENGWTDKEIGKAFSEVSKPKVYRMKKGKSRLAEVVKKIIPVQKLSKKKIPVPLPPITKR